MKKGDVGMAKHFKQGMSFNYLQSYVKMPVSAWCNIPTSLPQEPSSILCSIQALDTKRPVASLVEGGLLPAGASE